MRKLFDAGGHEMRKYLIVLLVLSVIYLVLTFLAPAAVTTNKYGLTLTQVNILRLTVVIPLLFIWASLIYSITHFHRYRSFVKDAPEGEGFRKFTIGLWMLLLAIMVPNLVSSIANFWPDSDAVLRFSTILRNYLSIIFYLIGFWHLWQGSRDLFHTVKAGLPSNRLRYSLMASILILGIIFVFTVFHNPYRSVSDDPLVRPTYYLSDILIVLTIIVPYVLTWLFGALTILNLLSYTERVQGIIYRKTFSSVAYGLIVTIILLIGLQFLSQANAAMSHSTIKVILMIIYVLLLAIAIGYLLIARGARKLAAIEEVK